MALFYRHLCEFVYILGVSPPKFIFIMNSASRRVTTDCDIEHDKIYPSDLITPPVQAYSTLLVGPAGALTPVSPHLATRGCGVCYNDISFVY